MSHGDDGERHRSGSFTLGLVLLIPVLYVLSVGPAAVIAVRADSHAVYKAIEVFYAPLIWLHDHTFLKHPLEKYTDFWRRLTDTKIR